MTITPLLTDEQRQALRDSDDRGPVTVVDPQTNVNYVLLRADLYDRCRLLLSDEEFNVNEAYPLMDDVARREGWLDPQMDAYDQLDPLLEVMSVRRGDVVLVEFPFAGGGISKVRPALVIQNDRLTNTVIALITSRIERSGEPSPRQLWV